MSVLDETKKVLFIHIPKTGGETITRVFWGTQLNLNNGKHRHLSFFAERYDLTKFYKFGIVRHPYERLLSYYRYLLKKPGRQITVDFSNWIKDMTGEPKWLFAPQATWVDNSVEIFKFEQGFENIISEITSKCGLVPVAPLKKYNASVDHRVELTDTDKEIIYSKYKDDFVNFDYKA